MMKRSIHQENNKFVNMYAPITGASKNIKQKLTSKERNRQHYNNSKGF